MLISVSCLSLYLSETQISIQIIWTLTVSCCHSYSIDSRSHYMSRNNDRFSSLTLSIPQYNRLETAVQKSGKPQKTQSHTRAHTQAKWWQCVTSLALSARWWKGGERERERGRWEKKRSLMIKLSPDLVFDRGRSCTATTRRSQKHTQTLLKWQAQLRPCQAT